MKYKNMKYRKIFFPVLMTLVLAASLSGCGSPKDVLYFQDIDSSSPTKIQAPYEPVIMKDDKLQIVISGPDKSVVMPYNFTLSDTGNGQGTQAVIPYLVDSQGCIDMPGLGRLKVEGMRRTDLVDHITWLLTERGLVKEPVVSVSFLNYRITVLGEVKNPGTYTMPSERVTVLQSLGMAGDLLLTADRRDILLIRDVDGVQTHHKIDLTSSDLLSSPYFYMHQNDVLYVPQSAERIKTGTADTTMWSLVLSTLTSLLSIATVIIAIVR